MSRWVIVLGLIAGITSAASASIIALKQGATLTHTDPLGTGSSDSAGGILDTRFTSLTSANVVTTTVTDTVLVANAGDGRSYQDYGAATRTGAPGTAPEYGLIKFDLSVLGDPSLITINKAQLRMYHSGNTGTNSAGRVLTDWVAGTKTGGYPGASPAEVAANFHSPKATNTSNSFKSGDPTWASGNFSTDAPGDTGTHQDGDMNLAPNAGTNNRWWVYDITSIAQTWVGATSTSNYGVYTAYIASNNNLYAYLSEQGGGYEPVLFLDYTVAPEPATLLLLGLGGLGVLRRR